ncbi:MAG: family 2B encapsulin nanocompartment shell protein [Salibacteraceae bacterium]|nr:family 2B encapsulin nanocompartment shell protein [Salibacteraceae bacterium]|tara:strand:+ start:1114 stop:2544 length:1431 start_codon:yes stop_codon:yes gene_type:complete
MAYEDKQQTISIKAARNLTHTDKTGPMMVAGSPRLLLKLLPWREVPGGTLRVNRTKLVFKGSGRVTIEFGDGGVPVITPEAFRLIPMFYQLPMDIVSNISSMLKMEQYDMEAIMIKQGEDRDKLFILADGSAEFYSTGSRGEELRHKIIGPGNYFGEDELVADVVAGASVRTLTKCVFITLSKSDLHKVLKKNKGDKELFEDSVTEQMEILAKANEYGERRVEVKSGHQGIEELPKTFVDYIEDPEEIPMNAIQTILKVHSRVTDLYNNPISQLQMQINITMAYMYESQESALINDPNYGLLTKCHPNMRLQPKYGTPTPDDVDSLLAMVWKKPTFFLAHPRAIAAFSRECTNRGTPPPTTNIDGQTVITWRGIPFVPSDKIKVDGHEVSKYGSGRTSILLIRAGGEDVQGVTGLYQTGTPGEIAPGMSVRTMGIDDEAIARYLMTLYYNVAVLTEDALAVLENVEVGYFHDYSEK